MNEIVSANILVKCCKKTIENLKIRLLHDKLNRVQLISALIEGYVKDNVYLRRFIEDYKYERGILNKKNYKKALEQNEGQVEQRKLTPLSRDEIEELYDVFEEE